MPQLSTQSRSAQSQLALFRKAVSHLCRPQVRVARGGHVARQLEQVTTYGLKPVGLFHALVVIEGSKKG